MAVSQEARDCLLGRLFAYGALARSGRITEDFSNKNTPYIKEFTSSLISLAAKKRYLQEPAVLVMLELVEKVLYNCNSLQKMDKNDSFQYCEGCIFLRCLWNILCI